VGDHHEQRVVDELLVNLLEDLVLRLLVEGGDWGYYCDPEMDQLFDQVRTTFDKETQNKVLQKVHEKYASVSPPGGGDGDR
jgi:ABC-type transport system substrate-binding protein